jgi:hypothetical protein
MSLREFLAAGGIARFGNRVQRPRARPTRQDALDALWLER